MGCSVYQRAFTKLREGKPDEKEEAVMVLEAWRGLEQQSVAAAEPGSVAAVDRQAALQTVEKRMPRRVKRKRPIITEDGLEAGMEVSVSRPGSLTFHTYCQDPSFRQSHLAPCNLIGPFSLRTAPRLTWR